MRKIFCIASIIIFTQAVHAQIKAITDDGRQVILYADGTWRYEDSLASNLIDTIPLSTKKFTKTTSQTFLVKSKLYNVGVYINPAKWRFEAKGNDNGPSEYQFTLKSGGGYAMMINEKIGVDLSALKNVALINARNAAPDARIVSSEYRIVNGKKILCLRIKATIQSIKFEYFGYYFSNENGTTQLLCYGAEKDVEDAVQKGEYETFLNGFVEIAN